MSDGILSVAVVADTLKLSRQRVHQLIIAGKLPAHQFDGIHWVVYSSDLGEYIGAQDLERSLALKSEWLQLRRAILAQGGIGPSPDWPRDWYPGDLYRKSGKAPDLVAVETHPWATQWSDDAEMFNHLQRVYAEHKAQR